MRRKLLRVFALIVLATPWGLGPGVRAQVPDLVTFQGRLEDSSSRVPLPPGNYEMDFSIWDSESGTAPANLLWQEAHPSVAVGSEGLFQSILGGTNPISAGSLKSGPAWLEMRLSSQVTGPRRRLGSHPYAWRAEASQSLGGQDPAAFALASEAVEENVYDFGATGNGVTDDTLAILQALSAAINRGGGIVRFPPGRYLVSSPIPINFNNLSLVGAGREASVLVAARNDVSILTVKGWRLDVNHLGFEGGYTAIDLQAGAIHKVHDCRITGSRFGVSIGTQGSDTIQHQISHVEFIGITSIAIYLHHCGEVYLNDITITGQPDTAFGLVCDTFMTALYCERIWITGGKPVTVRDTFSPQRIPEWLYFNNVHADNGAGYGWRFEAGHGYGLVACSALRTRGGPGVVVTNAVNGEVVLEGCTFSQNDQHGVYLSPFNANAYTRVEGCRITDNSRVSATGNYSGIRIDNSVARVLLKGNSLSNQSTASGQKHGIHIGTGCTDFLVSKNICTPHRSDGAGIFNESGTGSGRIVQNNLE